MIRRPLQIGRPSFHVKQRDDDWWVLEEYDLMGHTRSRDEREEWYGPLTEGEARAKAAAWNEEAKR